jgi:acetyl-CoA acetyltransferase
MLQKEIFVVGAARTPIGFGGSLKDVPLSDLVAPELKRLVNG